MSSIHIPMPKLNLLFISNLASTAALSLAALFIPSSVFAAEQIRTSVQGVGLAFPLSALEQFGRTGEVSGQLAPFVQALDQPTRDRLQSILLKQVPIDPAQLERLVATPLMQPLLTNLGNTFQTSSQANGEAEIRVALVKAAADPVDGLTLLNVLRQFPDSSIDVNLPALIQLTTQLETLSAYREAAVNAVIQVSEQEAAGASRIWLPDLRNVNQYVVEKYSYTFKIPHSRYTVDGWVNSYEMPVDFYLPQIDRPVPLIIMSHGFGATRTNYAYLAEYSAAQGFAVAALEHLGSDLQYRQVFLEGDLGDIVEPAEYISRSRDITYLIDALASLPQQEQPWVANLDLRSIGVFGNSLGGTTALSVAGAAFNPARLQQDCMPDRVTLSVSFLLQCIAKTAPFDSSQHSANLYDPRIKAVFAAYPLTSSLFGPEGMADITIPTLIMAGSNDLIAPVVQDQIQPFIWLQTADKYLALLKPGTHFSSSDDAYVQGFPPTLLGPSTALGREYLQTISTAFFGSYLGDRQSRRPYLPYLNASYARRLSQDPLQLYLIRSLTPEQLEQSYGRPLPGPIIPPPVSLEP